MTHALAQVPMSNQEVQLPPERTLTSTRMYVPEGVVTFQDGMRVSKRVAVV